MNRTLDAVQAAVLVLEPADPGDRAPLGGKSRRLPALRLTDENRCALELLGAPDCEALSAQVEQVFPGEALVELQNAWRELSDGAERSQLFCELCSLSGGQLSVKLTLAKSADGELVVTLFDSNPASSIVRRETEARLAESEARFRTMADCAPVLLWQAGTDTGCDFFNEFWLKFTGRDVDDELGSGWASGVHPEDFQECMSTFLAAFVERRQFRMEYRLRRHDGQYRWVLDTGVPHFDPPREGGGFAG